MCDNTKNPNCMHDHKHHDHDHGPKGHCKGKERREFLKSLDQNSLEAIYMKTAHKLMHSSKEDLQNGAAFSTLSPEEKEQLRTILEKVSAQIKEEMKPHEKVAEAADGESDLEAVNKNA